MNRSEQRSARAAQEADRRASNEKKRADGLARAIREHYRKVHAGDWGADDDLWMVLGLESKIEEAAA